MARVVSIGQAADNASRHVIEAMLTGDVPCEGPRLWGLLSSAAHEARARGVRITLIRRGFHCQVEGRSEIVTFAEADLGVLNHAIDRLAPLPEDPEF